MVPPEKLEPNDDCASQSTPTAFDRSKGNLRQFLCGFIDLSSISNEVLAVGIEGAVLLGVDDAIAHRRTFLG